MKSNNTGEIYRTKGGPMTRNEALEIVRDLFSPAELAVTLAIVGFGLLLIITIAATLYSTFNGIPIQ